MHIKCKLQEHIPRKGWDPPFPERSSEALDTRSSGSCRARGRVVVNACLRWVGLAERFALGPNPGDSIQTQGPIQPPSHAVTTCFGVLDPTVLTLWHMGLWGPCTMVTVLGGVQRALCGGRKAGALRQAALRGYAVFASLVFDKASDEPRIGRSSYYKARIQGLSKYCPCLGVNLYRARMTRLVIFNMGTYFGGRGGGS